MVPQIEPNSIASKWGYINILSQTHRLTTNKHYQSPQGMITRHTQGYGRACRLLGNSQIQKWKLKNTKKNVWYYV